MNRKILVAFLIFLILAIIAFMVNDLFNNSKTQIFPFETINDSLIDLDTSLISHREIAQLYPQIDEINGITVNGEDDIIIVGSEVVIYNKLFEKIKSFKLEEPASSVGVSSIGNLYIGVKNRIEVRNKNGQLIKKWNVGDTNSIITGIAVGKESVFVADVEHKIVLQFNMEGVLINKIGAKDSLKAIPGIIIRSPFFDVAIGRDDEIWISNPGRYMLEAFDLNGDIKYTWGKYSNKIEDFGGCCNPTNFTVLRDGSFITGEKALPRVKMYSPDGRFMSIIAASNQFDKGTKGLDVAVDSKSRIYILDDVRKQIRVFEKKNN